MIPRKLVQRLYAKEGKSMKDIATLLGCSVHRVQYWMDYYGMRRRSISEAVYRMNHPDGDPFRFTAPKTSKDQYLFGMGIGLYWGEGTKANKHAVRLGNTDPELLKTFLAFLVRFFHIRKKDCQFGLQLFTDIDPEEALDFWTKKLKIHRRQFYKTTITRSGSIGTYRQKSRYGVLTIYYSNRKLRDLLVSHLPRRSAAYATAQKPRRK